MLIDLEEGIATSAEIMAMGNSIARELGQFDPYLDSE
jgi:hypothetical protein